MISPDFLGQSVVEFMNPLTDYDVLNSYIEHNSVTSMRGWFCTITEVRGPNAIHDTFHGHRANRSIAGGEYGTDD